MDKEYVTLFTDLAHATEILAEQVLELDNNTSKAAAETMRKDYSDFYDKMRAEDFDPASLTRADFAKLMIGALINTQQLEKRSQAIQRAIQGYKIDVIPKLERIIKETTTDEQSQTLANELFKVKES